MKKNILILLAYIFITLILPGCKQKKSNLPEESFLGEWYTVKGDVEAYSFLKDSSSYIFVGTQNMRPVVYGRWKINKDKFVISMDNGTSSAYKFVLSNDTLTFNSGEQIYTRTEPFNIMHPEVRILANIATDFSGIRFSEPNPADLKWGFLVDSTNKSEKITLKGYSISAGTTLSSGSVSDIYDYIKEYGFDPDTLFISEKANGFRDDNQIITVTTRLYPSTKSDSIFVLITSALILK
jgi:hypothetical protein